MVKTCNPVSPARCAPGVAQHGTGQCSTADCGTAQHGAAQRGRARHSTRKHGRSSSPLAIPRAPQRWHRQGVQPLSPDPARVHPGQHGSARPGSAPGLPLRPWMQHPEARAGPGRAAAAAARGPHGGSGRVRCPGSACAAASARPAPFTAERAVAGLRPPNPALRPKDTRWELGNQPLPQAEWAPVPWASWGPKDHGGVGGLQRRALCRGGPQQGTRLRPRVW